MAKAYCKYVALAISLHQCFLCIVESYHHISNFIRWPVIAAIVSASLILLIIVWCIVGCLCFGTACCCGCCACCRGRGGGRRRRRDKDIEPHPPQPPPVYAVSSGGYQPTPAPHLVYQAAPSPSPAVYQATPSPAPTSPYQQRPVHEDALPPMPTWQTAQERRIMNEREFQGVHVELGQLHTSPPVSPVVGTSHSQQQMPYSPPGYDSNAYPYGTGPGAGHTNTYGPAASSPNHYPQQPHRQQQGGGYPYDPVSPASPSSSYSYPSYSQPLRYDHSGAGQAPSQAPRFATSPIARKPPPTPIAATAATPVGVGSSYDYYHDHSSAHAAGHTDPSGGGFSG